MCRGIVQKVQRNRGMRTSDDEFSRCARIDRNSLTRRGIDGDSYAKRRALKFCFRRSLNVKDSTTEGTHPQHREETTVRLSRLYCPLRPVFISTSAKMGN